MRRRTSSSGGGWRRAVLACLLALLAVVCLWRALDLGRHGWRPSAPGEQRWLGWGTGNGWERAALAALPETPPGDADDLLTLRVETPGPVRLNWLRAQVQYVWPGRQVVAVEAVAPGAAAEGAAADGRMVVEVSAIEPLQDAPPTAGDLVAAQPTRDLGALAVTLAAALALGVLLLPRTLRRRTAEGPVVATVLGLTVLTPATLLAALFVPRLPPGLVVPAVLAVAAVLLAVRRRHAAPARRVAASPAPPPPSSPRWLLAAAVVVVLLALAVFAVKTVAAPLWTWDHHSIWGLKARVMGAVGAQPGLLGTPALERSSTSYPMGLPALFWTAALGRPPTAALFETAHVLFGLGLVLLVPGAVRRAGGGRFAAVTMAALVAASPLLWDTEHLGKADLPLALWALAGVVALVEPPSRGGGRGRLVAAGAILGFLPWLKGEGVPLAVLLLAGGLVLVVLAGRERLPAAAVRLLGPAAVLALLLGLAQHALGAHGISFFTGNWQGRLATRLGDAGGVLARLGRELVAPPWLGGWVLFAAAVVLLLVARRWAPAAAARRTALVLAAVVAAQLCIYGVVYLATYLPPTAHIESSFRRIAAALLPLAAVTVGLALSPRRR